MAIAFAGAWLVCSFQANAAIVLGSTSTGSMNNASSATISHTTASGSDRLMIVGVSAQQPGQSITSATYNGVSLTKLNSVSNGSQTRVEIWYLVAPPVGTFNVVLNNSSSDNAIIGVQTYTGVDQTAPFGAFVSATGTGTTATVNASSAAGQLVFGVVGWNNGNSNSVGAGQSEYWDAPMNSSIAGAGSTEAGAATVTISWTNAGSQPWSIAAVPIKPGATTAPGGVSGLSTWFKTDAGTSLTGSVLTTWTNQNTANPAIPNVTGSSGNTFTSGDGISYLPSVAFSGATPPSLSYATTGSANNFMSQTSGTIYSVLIDNSIGSANYAFGWGINIGASPTPELSFLRDGIVIDPTSVTTTINDKWIGNGGSYGTEPAVLAAKFSINSTTDDRCYFNGKSGAAVNLGNESFANGRLYVGGIVDGFDNYGFDGTIGEILSYDVSHSDAERNKIESYLAAKWGVTLDQTTATNYTSSNGTVFWNATTNATYKNRVTVIGRDDLSTLNKKQSKSVHSGLKANLGLGTIAASNAANANTFSADHSFLAFGDDNASVSAWTGTGAPASRQIVARKWKVQETGTVGSVKVQVADNSGADGLPAESNTVYLLVDADGNFAAGATEIAMALNGANWEANVDFTNGQFFTFATADQDGPGGVNSSLSLWLKADAGTSTTTEGGTVTTWSDQSGGGNNATTTVNAGWTSPGANPPLYRTGSSALGLNFNPSLDFAGDKTLDGAAGLSPKQVFAVFKNPVSGRDVIGFDDVNGGGGGAQSGLIYWSGEFQYFARNSSSNNYFGARLLHSIPAAQPLVFDGQHVTSATGSLLVNGGGSTSAANLGTPPSPFTGAYRLNKTSDNQYPANGQIAEVISFNSNLSTTDRQKVGSYLALKYGITLSHNYLNSSATTVYDVAAYGNNVAGIGRDDLSTLNQKQSRSVNATSSGDLVTMGLGTIAASNAANSNTFSGDKSFMVWGDDAGLNEWTPLDVPSGRVRLKRAWKMQETGSVGNVTVRVQDDGAASGAELPPEYVSVYLLVDADGTFASGATEIAMTLNGTDWETTYDFTNGQYFTFATKTSPATDVTFEQGLPICTDLVLPAGGALSVVVYVNVVAGSLPANPDVQAVLAYGSTVFATLANPVYSSGAGTLTWTGTLASNTTLPAGQPVKLTITSNEPGVGLDILYDSQDKPSKIGLPANNVITVDELNIYDAAYPAGSVVFEAENGGTVYVRTTVSDPFGGYDVNRLDLKITGPSGLTLVDTTLTDTNKVADTACGKIYEYPWTTGTEQGVYKIKIVAHEGYENIADSAEIEFKIKFNDFGTPCSVAFTDGADPVTEYNPNASVCVRVTDIDQNTNPATVQTLAATLKSTAGDTENITMTETGVNTGIFTACIASSATVAGSSHNGQLYAPGGSSVDLAYLDPTDSVDLCEARAIITSVTPALAISKTLSLPADGVALVGEQVAFDILITNTGPTTLNTVTLTDNFPACLTYVSAAPTHTSSGGGAIAWNNLGPMAPGASKTVKVWFTAASPCSPGVNSASVSAVDENSAPVSSGPSTASVTITDPKLAIDKSLTSPATGPYVVGNILTYNISLTNTGTTTITNLPLVDQYSDFCLQFLSASFEPDGIGGGTLFWNNLGPLAVGSTKTITVQMKIANGCSPVDNLAAVEFATDINGDPVPPVQDEVSTVVQVPPVAEDDSDTTTVNTPVGTLVLPNDYDLDGNLDPASISTTGLLQPANGTLSVDTGTGVVTYTPNNGFAGTDSYQYSVCDLTGLCDTARVLVLVVGPEICSDGIDNDSDGLIDCADPDCSNFTSGGTIGSDESGCSPFNPAAINSLSLPSGGSGGEYFYKWQKSTDGGATWTDIAGVYAAAYDPPLITQTTRLRRAARRMVCAPWVLSNVVVKTWNAAAAVNAGTDQAICFGASATLTAVGSGGTSPYTYAWSDGLGSGASQTVSPASTTTYTVTVTAANGCTATGQVTVNVNALPVANAGQDVTICHFGSATLVANANGGASPYTFSWSHGLGDGQIQEVTPVADTTIYTVTVTDANGCSSTDEVMVAKVYCPEVCDNGIDDDGDGLVDCEDPDCSSIGAPFPEDDVYGTCPGAAFTEQVIFNDGNLQSPVYSIFTNPTKGSVTMQANGVFTYTPNVSDCTTDRFVYQICNQVMGCCDTASVFISIGDNIPPVLSNVPADVTISCDDIVPTPPVIIALDACPGIYISMDEVSDYSPGVCENYTITRTWTATDLCGNSAAQSQVISVQDAEPPELFRVYTLPSGKKMAAGVAKNVTQAWKQVPFPIAFAETPLVFSQVVSHADTSAVTVRQRNIAAAGFELRLQEQESADGAHQNESVAWVAIEPDDTPGQNNLQTGLLTNVTQALKTLTFPMPFTSLPMFITAAQTTADADPALGRYTNLTASSAQVFMEEEKSKNTEVAHGNEILAYFAMNPGFDLLDEDNGFAAETGTLAINNNWQTVTLYHTFNKPVVIFGGLSLADAEPATIRVRNVTSNSFQVRVQEWDYLDGAHPDETASYIVVEGSVPSEPGFYCANGFDNYEPGVNVFVTDNCDNMVNLSYQDESQLISAGLSISRTWTATDICGNILQTVTADTCPIAALQLKAVIHGAMLNNGGSPLMRDDLRKKGLVPLAEPYASIGGYHHKGAGGGETISQPMLDVTGDKAIVDWMFVEIRDANSPATVLATCSALLQRNGDIINASGDSVLVFPGLPEGDYHVAVRHRNHLGLMTDNTWYLQTSSPPLIDFRNISMAVSGAAEGGNTLSSSRTLWSGDLNGDRSAVYQGPNNDIFNLFSKVLADDGNVDFLANFIGNGYAREDLNLDGRVIYQGPNNDRAAVLYHSVLVHPGNLSLLANFIVREKVP